jgi:phage terminase large subunit
MSFRRTTTLNKILAMDTRKKVIQGGSSAGKTFAIIAILIDRAIKEKNLIDVISMTYEHLSTGAIQDFKNIMEETGRWNQSQWNETRHFYKFKNGSTLRFKAIDKEGKAKGPRRDILYINEANHIPYNIYNQLSIRTNKDIYIDFNPQNTFWAHEEVLTEDDSSFIIVNYLDNEALNSNVIKELEGYRIKAETTGTEYWKNRWRVYGLGQTGKIEGVIFENWSTIRELPKEAELIDYGLDFGFSNDEAALIAGYKWNGKIILKELIFKKGLTNPQLSNLFKDVVDPSYCIWADSSEPKSIQELRNLGWAIYGVKKGPDSVIHGINLMQQREILITEDSQNLINEFQRYSWQTDNIGKSMNKPQDKWNHGIDAVRYLFAQKLMYDYDSGVKQNFSFRRQ